MDIKYEKKIKDIRSSESKLQQKNRQDYSPASFSVAERKFILSIREKIKNYN